VHIYNSEYQVGKSGSVESALRLCFFRQFSDTFSNELLTCSAPMTLRSWSVTIENLITRIREAIREDKITPSNPFPVNNILRAVDLLTELRTLAVTFAEESDYLDDKILALLDFINRKVAETIGKKATPRRASKVSQALKKGMQKLSLQQLVGLALFYISICVTKCDKTEMKLFLRLKRYKSDLVICAIKACVDKEWLQLSKVFKPLLNDEEGNDLSKATIMSAKLAGSCYKSVFAFVCENKKGARAMLPLLPIQICHQCFDVNEPTKKSKKGANVWFCSECEASMALEAGLVDQLAAL
jgi:hypothetical protein